MTKIELAKNITSLIVGAGTSKIVQDVAKNNTNPQNVGDQVTITVGSFVLGAMVADAAKTYTDSKIDEMVSWWKTTVQK